MRDQYNVEKAGAVGPGSHAEGISFTEIRTQSGDRTDLLALAKELTALREALLKEAREPQDFVAVGAIASAQIEAQKREGPKALEHLSRAGRWALDVATKIGTTVAAAAIKESLGIK